MKMLILGDSHADWSALNKLIRRALYKHPDITAIAQLGDFGIFWPKKKSGFTNYNPVTDLPFYFICGNHDRHDWLKEYDKHPHAPNLIYVPRGTVLEIEEYRILCIGGASSVDKDYRLGLMNSGQSRQIWWPEESITRKDFERAMANEGPIHAIFSHDKADAFKYGPLGFQVIPEYANVGKSDRIAVQALIDKFQPSHSFFRHYHLKDQGVYTHFKHEDWTETKFTNWYCAAEVGNGAPMHYLIWNGESVNEY